MTIPNLYQSFWETLSEKDWNKHFWPFLVYTSLSGENCWKKFGTTIFGPSKFIPVLLGNIVRKRLEQTFLAIPNLYQSFWEKLLEKIGTTIFGHSKFIPVFLGKIVLRKKIWNGHFLAMPNLYQSSWEKLSEKNWNNHIWPFLIYTSLLGKIVGKNWNIQFWPFQIYTSPFGKHCWKKLEQTFLAIPNLYQSFWEKLLEKIGTTIFGHSKFIPWETLSEKDWNHLYQSFWEKLLEKIGTTIFGHSKFIPVLLGKIVGKNSEWPFLAIPNLYQSS